MLTLTDFGLSVLVVDADIVFLGDPTKADKLAGNQALSLRSKSKAVQD